MAKTARVATKSATGTNATNGSESAKRRGGTGMSTGTATAKTSLATAKQAAGDAVPAVTGSEAHYGRYLREAQALDARDVKPFHGNASLAYHNAADGVAALLALRAQLARELPTLDLTRLATLPELVLALLFAESRIDRGAGSGGTLGPRLVDARKLRKLMLKAAESLAESGEIPAREVVVIRRGKGPIDTAQDLVDLGALFRKYAAKVKGKTTVTAEHVQRAATSGTELLTLLKPMNAKKTNGASKSTAQTAADVRDRFWTLVAREGEKARRAGLWVWGEAEVDQYVPLLQARAVRAAKGTSGSGSAASGSESGTAGSGKK